MIILRALIGVAVMSSGASAAVRFDALSFDTSAYARAQDGPDADTNYQGNAGPAATTYQPVVTQTANAAAAFGTAAAATQSTANVAFTNPSRMRLTSNIGLNLSLAGVAAQGVSSGSAQINYYFTIDQSYVFNLFDGLSSNAQFNNSTVIISNLNGSPMDPPALLRSGPGPLPFLNGLLTAGSYNLFLSTTSGANYTAAEVGTYSALASNRFDFILLAAAPEPATWLSLLAGFGMVGAAARRRYPRAATI